MAKELAKIYLMSYRMDRAARAIERWRALAPQDPEPCLWSNEIASRSSAETAVLIQNYRAALDRDPDLDKARLGLAQAISKDRQFDEAERRIRSVSASAGPKTPRRSWDLGRNAFQQGNIEDAGRYFETAFHTNPRDPETLKEVGQLDLRLGRVREACERLKLLTEIDPYTTKFATRTPRPSSSPAMPASAKLELDASNTACAKSTTRSFSSGTAC